MNSQGALARSADSDRRGIRPPHRDAAPPGSTIFISHGPPDAPALLAAVRGHGRIENSLHWVWDVAFREGECRLPQGGSAAHLFLCRNTRTKLGIETKCLEAGWNLVYRTEILVF